MTGGGARFILGEGRVERDGRQVQLTPHLAALFGMICRTWPEPCHAERIMSALYRANRNAKINVGVGILHLRRRLQPIGLRIENVRGYGFRVSEQVVVE